MVKKMRLGIIFSWVVCISLLLAGDVFANDIIVKAKADKDIYGQGEEMTIVLEVENHTDFPILPDPVDVNSPHRSGNFLCETYWNKWWPYNMVQAELVGWTHLMPIKLKQGSSNPVTIPPHSTAVVGIMYSVANSPDVYFHNVNFFIKKLYFSGKMKYDGIGKMHFKRVGGSAIITYKVEP